MAGAAGTGGAEVKEVTFRWLTSDEIADVLNPVLRVQGMAQLNVNSQQPTCRVLGGFQGDRLVQAFAWQLYPMLGPMVKVDSTFRDGGEVSRELATRMTEYFITVGARAAICIADSPVTERLCERFGMTRIESPVFSFTRKE
jgi:hypothetical protein